MRPRHLVLLLRLSLFVALVASAALVADYQSAGDPAFCSMTSGCGAVRVSGYAYPLGLPLPNLGLAAFASLLAGSLLARTRMHHLLLSVATGLGGVIALFLVAIQAFELKTFCAYCVVVDTTAFVAAVAAGSLAAMAARARTDSAWTTFADRVNPGGAELVTWAAAGLAAIALPLLWGKYPTLPELPSEIAAAQVPGKVTLVGFTDFECPFCRRLGPEIHRLEEQYGDRIHYIRKMAPLPRHPGAMPAAKAYICATPEQREAAAALLYTASPGKLTDEGVLDVLKPIRIDPEEFAACLAAPKTLALVEADLDLYRRVAGLGLPFTYVGRRVVLGMNPARLDEVIRLELAGGHTGLPLAGLWVALAAIAAAASWMTLRKPAAEGDAHPDEAEPKKAD
ncbi:vitamin K epoxide reductase family protein [Chondromyces apiculatus]|uniref:DSBA oxidoreductase n=1 Tax=Chondromyces apiculatus DSM 436 TaxID=1192034 RepID=A0A017SUD6_9BACT|nr:vitamin K epoxide reductase family protein [Chondromyces apiculatus]EYF00397.1 DSBA oxidoreductase [Chondromyces apiculatus DSM 436]